MEDTLEPTEAIHFEYRFIKAKAGPLYKTEGSMDKVLQI